MNDFKSSNQCGGTFNLLTYCMISSDLPVRVTEVHAGRSKHNFKHFPTTKGSRKPRLQTCQEFLVWHIKNKLGSLGAGFTDLLTITKFQPCGSPWAPNFESSVEKIHFGHPTLNGTWPALPFKSGVCPTVFGMPKRFRAYMNHADHAEVLTSEVQGGPYANIGCHQMAD